MLDIDNHEISDAPLHRSRDDSETGQRSSSLVIVVPKDGRSALAKLRSRSDSDNTGATATPTAPTAAVTPVTPLSMSMTAINFPTPNTPTRHLFRTPITVIVGANAHPFSVHLEILLTTSPFFLAYCNPSHKFRNPSATATADGTGNIILTSVAAADFEFFVQWLYTRTLDHEDLEGAHPAYFKLVRLYSMADFLGVTALKNAIIDEIAAVADRTNSCPTPDDTRAVWDDEGACSRDSLRDRRLAGLGAPAAESHTRRESGDSDNTAVESERDVAQVCKGRAGGEGGLRELISDLFAWKKTDRLIAEHADLWDERFLRAVVVKLMTERRRKQSAPWRDAGEACQRYHFHDDWAPICPHGIGSQYEKGL